MSQLVIFTDLDGTLLDHHSYSFNAALESLAEIKAKGIPLILVSSKTRAELESLQNQLQIETPFVCENGAAVFWRERLPDSDSIDWRRYELSTPRSTLLPIIHRLRQEYGYEFSGFSDWDIEELMEKTGLDGVSATLASQRDYTEPLLWRDTADRFDLFKMQLGNYKLRAVQGGRFISVMGHFDKLDGMRYLIDRYQQSSAITTLALGDSPNDEQMLNAADIAVVIKSPRSNTLIVQDAGEVIYTDEPGPVGWQKAMEGILGGHT